MDILSVTQEQRDSVYDLSLNAGQISQHASRFLKRLASVLDTDFRRQHWDAILEIEPDGTTAQLNSAFGRGKGELRLFANGKVIQGVWELRKSVISFSGEIQNPVVATLRFTTQGFVFRSDADDRPIQTRTGYTPDEDREAQQTMESLLFLVGAYGQPV